MNPVKKRPLKLDRMDEKRNHSKARIPCKKRPLKIAYGATISIKIIRKLGLSKTPVQPESTEKENPLKIAY